MSRSSDESDELEYDEDNRQTSAEQHEVAEIQRPIPIDEPVAVPITIEDYLRTDLDAAIFCPSKKAVLRTCIDFSAQEADRKSVVEGQSVQESVGLGGRRLVKKKNNKK